MPIISARVPLSRGRGDGVMSFTLPPRVGSCPTNRTFIPVRMSMAENYFEINPQPRLARHLIPPGILFNLLILDISISFDHQSRLAIAVVNNESCDNLLSPKMDFRFRATCWPRMTFLTGLFCVYSKTPPRSSPKGAGECRGPVPAQPNGILFMRG